MTADRINRLVASRDELRAIMRPLQRDSHISKDGVTDDEMRETIRNELAFIRSPENIARLKQLAHVQQ